MFRTFIIGMVALVIGNYAATALSGVFTEAALQSGVTLPDGTTAVASFDYAGNPITWLLYQAAQFKWIGAGILVVICIALMLYNRRKIIAEADALPEV